MNYLETGLPHTDLYKRKSDFVPPRYKPLCGLGRRYLGLEPVTKSEIKCVINRLSQPKIQVEPENRPKSALEVRSGTGRFTGRKKMNGNQIDRMVDRLAKRNSKTESENKPIERDSKKIVQKSILKSRERKSENRIDDKNKESAGNATVIIKKDDGEMVNTRDGDGEHSPRDTEVHGTRRESVDINGETITDDNLAQFQRIEEKMLAYLKAKEERAKAEKENVIPEQYNTGSTLENINETKERKSKKSVEERSYGSLYFRGVKHEIAKKFYNDTYKRPSSEVGRSSRSDSLKSGKTVHIVSPKSTRRNSRVDTPDNIRQKQRSKTT